MKSYPVSAAGGIANPAALDAVIVPPTLNTSSLSSIVSDLLANDESLLCIIVDLTARKVRAKAAVAGVATAAMATLTASAFDTVQDFTKDDLTVARSTFTAVGEAPATVDPGGLVDITKLVCLPQFPVLTSAQIVGLMEDAMLLAGGPLENQPLIVALDQGVPKVRVVKYIDADGAAAAFAAATAGAIIGYDQTVTVAPGAARQPLE